MEWKPEKSTIPKDDWILRLSMLIEVTQMQFIINNSKIILLAGYFNYGATQNVSCIRKFLIMSSVLVFCPNLLSNEVIIAWSIRWFHRVMGGVSPVLVGV